MINKQLNEIKNNSQVSNLNNFISYMTYNPSIYTKDHTMYSQLFIHW